MSLRSSSSLWYNTLKYALFDVKGYAAVATSNFAYRIGSTNSDMFRIAISAGEVLHPATMSSTAGAGGKESLAVAVTLADFHWAFFMSPIFQLELWLLSKVGAARKATVTESHLRKVAVGEADSFGPWKYLALEGDRQTRFLLEEKAVSPSSPPTTHRPETTMTSRTTAETIETDDSTPISSCTVVMRCEPAENRPFCDTWWAVEYGSYNDDDNKDGNGDNDVTSSTISSTASWGRGDDAQGPHRRRQRRVELVFGSALLGPQAESVLVQLLMPFHNLYSRILLASAKAKLVQTLRIRRQLEKNNSVESST